MVLSDIFLACTESATSAAVETTVFTAGGLVDQASDYLPMLIIGVCILIGMGMKMITNILTTMSHERSRREIAAYIAEGSLTPEQGERLLRADVSHGQRPG